MQENRQNINFNFQLKNGAALQEFANWNEKSWIFLVALSYTFCWESSYLVGNTIFVANAHDLCRLLLEFMCKSERARHWKSAHAKKQSSLQNSFKDRGQCTRIVHTLARFRARVPHAVEAEVVSLFAIFPFCKKGPPALRSAEAADWRKNNQSEARYLHREY